MMTTLDEFLTGFGEHPTTLIEVAQGEPSPFIVIKDGNRTVVINPLALGNHLSVDVHSFLDEERTTAGVMGMSNGKRHNFPETGTTSHGWPSTKLVAVIVGEQGES